MQAIKEGLKTNNVELVEETMCRAVKEHVQIDPTLMLIITNWLSQQASLKFVHERGQDTVGREPPSQASGASEAKAMQAAIEEAVRQEAKAMRQETMERRRAMRLRQERRRATRARVPECVGYEEGDVEGTRKCVGYPAGAKIRLVQHDFDEGDVYCQGCWKRLVAEWKTAWSSGASGLRGFPVYIGRRGVALKVPNAKLQSAWGGTGAISAPP